ncbi:hypothetical protein LY76DRAFT_625760 [Colletotrichum caudatum]|nr:hypothetical protein LY76DRAFT_625760 [Colletotrichum caudatum]
MHQPPPADQSTFESRAQYNLQATADDDDEDEHYELEKVPPSIPKRPNYRPKPLRWPFIVCIVAILTVLMALVVYACETMPNSDSTATIVARHIIQPREQSSSAGQQSSTAEPLPSSTPEPLPSHSQVNAVSPGSVELPTTSEQKQPPSSSPTPVPPVSQVSMQQAPASSESIVILSKATPEIISSSSAGEKTQTSIAAVIPERTSGTSEPTTPLAATSSSQPSTTSKASLPLSSSERSEKPSSSSIVTASESEKMRQMKGTSASVSTVSGASDQLKVPATRTTTLSTTSELSSTSTSTMRKPTGSDEILVISTMTFTATLTSHGSTVTYGTHYTSFVSSTFTTLIPTTFSDGSAITRTTTRIQAGTSFMTTMSLPMTTTRTTTRTIIEVTTEFPEQTPGGDDAPSTGFYTSTGVTVMPTTVATMATWTGPAVVYASVGTTEITIVSTVRREQNTDPTPVTHVITSVFDQKVVTVVETGAPQRVVVTDGETVVTRDGGQETEMVITVTPSLDVATTILAVESTLGAFRPVSLTIVSKVGGSTGVFTTTDPPETIRTTIDGRETTIVRTPAPREYTSVVGGTMPMSFTVITTVAPITLVTSISGKLSTTTSTPRPTTRLSTMMASTVTFTSVSRPTMTGSADTVITKVERVGFTSGDYFVGKFLPVILAVTITIPLRIIDLNAKLYQPFFAMAQEGGALGKNSLTLQFDGWKGFLAPFEVLMQGHPVPFITTLMLWSSAMLLHGTCRITAIEGCGIQLGVSTLSARALVGMIAFIIVLLLVLLYLLRSWDTGLHANPWSIAGISSLARNAGIRPHATDFKASEKAMAEKRYMLGFFENGQGRDEYAVSGALPAAADDEMDGTNQRYVAKPSRKPVPFIALTYWWRLGFILFLASLFILVLYYHVTLRVQTSFKQATDSQSWGVRFLLSALGVVIVFCWESIFVSIAIISPYYHMDRQSQQPESSILLTRPTNSFYGVYAAILEGNVVLMLAAFMAILAEFLPILLTNVPYNLTQTLTTHNICAVTSISILALMLVTLVASLFTKWPDMPVDPRSIAGAMYYINESRMLEDFEGLSKLNSDDREKRVKELGRRYFYGAISGKDGRRMAVDSIESVEDTAYTGGHWRTVTKTTTTSIHMDMDWRTMRRITSLGMDRRKGIADTPDNDFVCGPCRRGAGPPPLPSLNDFRLHDHTGLSGLAAFCVPSAAAVIAYVRGRVPPETLLQDGLEGEEQAEDRAEGDEEDAGSDVLAFVPWRPRFRV